MIDDIHHHLAKILRQNALTWLGDEIEFEEETLERRKRSVSDYDDFA